jgi:hypothetical protein
MVVQSAAGPTRREGFELLEAPGHIGVEVAMAARFREATQSQDVAIGDRLTAQVDGFHAHVHPRVRRLKPPIAPCLSEPYPQPHEAHSITELSKSLN